MDKPRFGVCRAVLTLQPFAAVSVAKLSVAICIVAFAATLAGLYAGETWNSAQRRAFVREPLSSFADPLAGTHRDGRDEQARDLYGNPLHPALGSYRIDASGGPFDEHDREVRRLKLRSPEG